MKKLDHHEEAISGRHQYQDPAELHNAVYNTNGYMHEDEPEGNVFQGLAIGLCLSAGLAAIVFILFNIAQ